MKRFTLHRTFCPTTTGGTLPQGLSFVLPAYPALRGKVSDAWTKNIAGEPCNFVNTPYLHLASCFAGWRGSIRYKIVPFNCGTDVRASVHLFQDDWFNNQQEHFKSGYIGANSNSRSVNESEDMYAIDEYAVPYGYEGTTISSSSYSSSAIEFEVPFYRRNRFIPGQLRFMSGQPEDNYQAVTRFVYIVTLNNPEPRNFFRVYVAAGEDFTPYMWVGPPKMYFNQVPPEPSPDVIPQ